jgi:hypothetical protein
MTMRGRVWREAQPAPRSRRVSYSTQMPRCVLVAFSPVIGTEPPSVPLTVGTVLLMQLKVGATLCSS